MMNSNRYRRGRRHNLHVGIISLAAIALSITISQAEVRSDWLVQRQAQFARWQSAHPHVDAQIADLIAKTTTLITQYQAHKQTEVTSLAITPVSLRPPGTITDLWDDPRAPEMAIAPAGRFVMGSPASEQGHLDNETQHNVAINYAFAIGKYDVTRDEYAEFVSETNRPDGASCFAYDGKALKDTPGRNWHNPGFSQTGRDPVVCVSWDDAQAYVSWLSQKTGKPYRLLSESEWEYAARAGTTTAYYWDDAVESGNANCNGCGSQWDNRQTSPVGSFQANAFSLYDMAGNVWQWVEDCWNDSYANVPSDGRSWSSDACDRRVGRGGSWSNNPWAARSANRHGHLTRPGLRYGDSVGFRVARTLY